MVSRLHRSTLFPYTTLFRSDVAPERRSLRCRSWPQRGATPFIGRAHGQEVDGDRRQRRAGCDRRRRRILCAAAGRAAPEGTAASAAARTSHVICAKERFLDHGGAATSSGADAYAEWSVAPGYGSTDA